ncbi:MAG: ABC transporter ATP-binding protein [Candidatus Kariarchaeaceae archaeon]|jgi:ABC-2 type transport system ATP-binding protein
MSQEEIVIKTTNLTKMYDDAFALKKLNLEVKKHSIFGFLGPNGAGKTTTIKLLIGLIQATSGSGEIFGLNFKKESLKIRSRIGYLPQEPSFYDHLSAQEILDFTIRFFFKGPKNEIAKRISEMLELVSLSDKANRPVKGYSTGEKQRLGIAQAMINYPDLLILDEPAASLDPVGRQDVLNIMSKLREYTTIFYSTHILDDVQKVSDHVAILNKGVLIAEGSIEEILSNQEGTIFSAKVQGDISKVKSLVSSCEWISNIHTTQLTEKEKFLVEITVSDEEQAEKYLLRELMKDNSLAISDFRRQKYDLEDIFMKKVEG